MSGLWAGGFVLESITIEEGTRKVCHGRLIILLLQWRMHSLFFLFPSSLCSCCSCFHFVYSTSLLPFVFRLVNCRAQESRIAPKDSRVATIIDRSLGIEAFDRAAEGVNVRTMADNMLRSFPWGTAQPFPLHCFSSFYHPIQPLSSRISSVLNAASIFLGW